MHTIVTFRQKDRWKDRHWDEGTDRHRQKDRWRDRHWDEGEQTDGKMEYIQRMDK